MTCFRVAFPLVAFLLLSTFMMQSLMGSAQAAPAIAMLPVAPVRAIVDDYFGAKVSDPYRYMENLKDPEVVAWMKAQNDYTRGVLAHIPGRAGLLSRVRDLDASVPARVRAVRKLAGKRYFYLKSFSAETIYKLYMRQGVNGNETLLVDPEKSAKGGPPSAINYFFPSDDGRYVAYGISEAGSEQAILHVLDTSTGRETGEAIDRTDFGSLAWLPDGRSFLYNRLQKLGPNDPIEERETKSRIYLHAVGKDAEHDPAVFGYGVSPLANLAPADSPYIMTVPGIPVAFGFIQHGAQNEATMYVAPLASIGKPNTPWKRVFDVDDAVTNVAASGDDLWLLTHKDAPHFKVIHTLISNPDLSHAQVVIPSGEAVVTDVQAAQDALYVKIRDGAVARLLRIGHEPEAKSEQIALPSEGSIGIFNADPRMPGIVFTLSGWTRAAGIYEYDPNTKTVVNTNLRPSGPFDNPNDILAVEVKVPAKDGTLVPLSIIHKRGLTLDGTNPTLLTGYGAYGFSMDPYFDPIYLAWLERGVLAIAHVRGGGEYGDDWHKSGQKLTKSNTWNDFIACAEYMVAKQYTSPARLAGWGVSAGGVLIGRAVTQRPELFGAALIEVGFTDTLRGEFEQNGPGEIAEWGTVKDPDGFKGLYEMSAYAHVNDGTRYPGVLLVTGSNDPRVAPFEPAKMTARLQAATASGKPVLLRVDYEAGHGIGSTKTQLEERFADQWSFLLWQFGVAGFQMSDAAQPNR